MTELKVLLERYPALTVCKDAIEEAASVLTEAVTHGHKLLICGNGGSAADAEHITGELMKSFRKKRPLPENTVHAFNEADESGLLARELMGAIPAIALDAHSALTSALTNDCDPRIVYAQQVYGYGKTGDVLLALSTSGNAENVLYAIRCAKATGIRSVLICGADGGRCAKEADFVIRLPETETYRVQELTLPVYHALCLVLEERCF